MLPDLTANIERAPIGSAWRHLKSGVLVTVVGHGLLEAECEPAVAYWAETPEPRVLWFRPACEFFDGRFVEVALAVPHEPKETT